VLTTGIARQRPQKGWVIAASVCGTIEALTRALAVELAPIRVNAVSPGVVRPLAEHERTGARTYVRKRGKESPCWPSRRSS
jgi:NAD(P)-dependent dehydrogenase (short-subunit alcohol dehydrogenase family)